MLTHAPDETLAHSLDPRSKLALQFGLAIAAFARPTVPRLVGLTVLGLACLAAAGLSVRRTLRAYRPVLVVLALGPLLAAVTLGPPWLQLAPALGSLRAVFRVVPVLFVGAAYVHSTPVRDTRAAVQWAVPGRPGRLLGVGVGLTFRTLPVVREDVRRVREALAVRLGTGRPVQDRASRIAVLAVRRSLDRADRLSVALRARCLAWNPTLPRLGFARRDYAVLALAAALAATPLLPVA